MGPAYYIMAILGCTDDERACQPVRLVEQHYVSADACAAATATVLPGAADAPFPVIKAECRRATAAVLAAATSLPALPRP